MVNDDALDTEGYQPTYAEAFPPLPCAPSTDQNQANSNPAAKWRTHGTGHIRSTTVTQVFRVPLEERRYKLFHEATFGDERQHSICRDIMAKTGASIEVSLGKDLSLTIMVTGKPDTVAKARRLVLSQLQTQAQIEIQIPREHHKFILGKGGKTLQTMELSTATKITMPRDGSDTIKIIGTKEGVDRARHEIQLISDQQAKLAFERLAIPKTFHPFISGPNNETANRIKEQTGAAINIPPPSVNKDELTVAGEKDGVAQAKAMILEIYEDKKRKTTTVSIEVRKSQHKYIVGPRGGTIHEILELTGVSVEMPPSDSDSETITLRGEQDKLGVALTQVYEKANSVVFAEVAAPRWLHRFIIGRRGQNIRKVTQDLPKVHVEFSDEKDSITLEGPPEQVESARESLEAFIRELIVSMAFAECNVDQKYHPHIIGKNGANGESRYLSLIHPRRHDVVSLRGPREDVDKVHAYLKKLNAELVAANYCIDVPIFKQFHKNVIGRGGTTIKKIREETDTKIELPAEGSDSDVIIITGHKAQVEAAREKILAIQNELANVTQLEVHIPSKFHNSIIGAKGRLIRSVMEDCGGVSIKFPPEGSNSDKVLIRGPKDDVEKAKKQLLELTNEKELGSYTVEIRAKPEHHRFLIGRGGASIRKVRENTGARIVFPAAKDEDKELITIIGKQEAVEAAKDELLKSIKDLDNICEGEVHVDPKWHRHFVAKRGEVLQEIAAEFGGVVVSFPRNGVNSDRVVLKGAKECVEGARQRVMEIVQELESMVTIECVIPQEFHRNIMGAKGANVQEVTARHKVQIKFPDRSPAGEEPVVNGDGEHLDPEAPISPRKRDIIIITGKKESAEAAKIDLLDLVPVTEQMHIPFDYHRFVIGPKGSNVRKMMDEFSVNISIPPAKDESDSVSVIGPRANVERAMKALEAKVAEIEAENEDRALRSFKMDVKVDRQYHPKIIGRKGQVITNIRKQYDVNIQFPPQDAPEESADVIGLTGYQHSCEAARDAILKIVKELEDQVSVELTIDPRIHRRLIGAKGRAVRKLMEQYKVDIRFPRQNANDPVVISGQEQDVEEAKEQLLLLEEEYMQSVKEEIEEYDAISYYMNPPSKTSPSPPPQAGGQGFVVRDAPWNAQGGKGRPPKERDGHPPPPDTTNTMDFPSIGNSVAPKTTVWGHRR
ncbi:predicted protein [Nematostella vectensis]|uniref:K Homology domain-containing protein n=1 Tax=Nematostella vectensis TaxID=45351 RepID=A7SFJ6_NEMVE|nr:predicted protein [Nematostella vectensis]|eukprot:XP_001629539.1 predicted protein [Nematostella vectensis]